MAKPTKAQRSKWARKAARTRAANAAAMKRWMEVDKPAHQAVVELANRFLQTNTVRLRWCGAMGIRLRRGVEYSTLLHVSGTGLSWRVLIDGYKHPQTYHPSFWEVVS